MKWIIIFLYWLITWILKYVFNILELIWFVDFKHFSHYGTHFLTLKNIKETEIEISVAYPQGVLCGTKYIKNDGLNIFERVVYWCVNK